LLQIHFEREVVAGHDKYLESRQRTETMLATTNAENVAASQKIKKQVQQHLYQ
jgi:hypothetical protein